MSTKQNVLSNDQRNFVAEMAAAYGIDPSEIMFFSEDAEPFFGYEATCVLCDRLTDLHDINLEPVASSLNDSLTLKCTITLADGRTRSGLGVVNVNERLQGPVSLDLLSGQQLYATASARAIRSALRTAGINLLKLHAAAKRGTGGVEFTGGPQDEKASLLRQVHALGNETGYIFENWVEGADGNRSFTDKTGWRRILRTRYQVEASSELNVAQLADLAAFLRTQLPLQKAAA
jgi:hypothetical protein